MDDQSIAIDINTAKLLEWLVSRRHVSKDWQNHILKIREKINNAIQDMPAHEGIIKLLSGQHINYFHCLEIINILKDTEKDTKNIFGMYGSQRMKDWQDVVNLYQKDNIYLGEAAQIMIRNVSYEIPSLKKQIQKLEQSKIESEKKIKDYNKSESLTLKEFNTSCEQLGIKGNNIKLELLELVKELPIIYDKQMNKIKTVKAVIDLYTSFTEFIINECSHVLSTLSYVVQNGNTTTYEFIHGEKPLSIEEVTQPQIIEEADENVIDFGDNIVFESNTGIDFGDQIVIENPQIIEEKIDWGSSRESSNEESFEIVNYDDLNTEIEISREQSGIIEKSGDGIARGDEALHLLDNSKYRDQIINDLIELEAFLKIRLFEMSNDSDLLTLSQMQEAPTILQMQTVETLTLLSDYVHKALNELTNRRFQHLYNIKHSPKYVDILTDTLKQKLSIVERIKTSKDILEMKIKDCNMDINKIEPVLKTAIEKTKELKSQIEEDISKKYKGRVVNIVGGINTL